MNTDGTTRIYICGVGGQGSITAGRLLGEAAMAHGQFVTVSEVHGMSQRGGIVEGAVLIGGAKSPLIGLGDADVLLAFEPLEGLRALPYCSEKTTMIVNRRPIIPFTVSIGQAKYPDLGEMIEQIRSSIGRVIDLDATALAEESGSPMAVNAVILGALAASGSVPVSSDILKNTVVELAPKKARESNAKAFDLGYESARQSRAR